MRETFREIVGIAERAVAGAEADKSELARLLDGADLSAAGEPEDRAYLAVLLDWLGMREQAMLALGAASAEYGDLGAGMPNIAGMLASGHGDYERARELFGQALSAAGADTSLRAKILANLAALSLLAGDVKSASAWLAQARDAWRVARNPATDVLLASTEFGIARVRADLSGLREAIIRLNDATRARVAELGSDHPLAITAVASLAAAEFEFAATTESVEDQERAIAVLEVLAHRLAADLGADHPQALACLENLCVADLRLALASRSVNQARRAASALESVSQRIAASRGEDHPQASTAAANAASATADLEEALAGHEPDLGLMASSAPLSARIERKIGDASTPPKIAVPTLPGDDELDAVATQEEFAQELGRLRTRSGLSARKIARLADVSSSALHYWLGGGRLPTGDEHVQALIRVLRACGVASPAEIRRWLEALERARRPVGRKPSEKAPYRGLSSFEVGDAHLFFGREEVAELLTKLMSESTEFHDRPLVLVGASGAGKSSVLRAGLLPRLPGAAVVFEPTTEPLAALRMSLAELESATTHGNSKGGRPTVVVDQFESLFTQASDEDQRREFITDLCDLAASQTAHVAIALRADFYGHAIRYPELVTALQHRQVVLGPMTAAQVSRAITEPARETRLSVEDGLVQLLLDDLAPHEGPRTVDEGAYEAGALPLLSHAMLATWENSSGGTLTIAAYLASGGIKGAVARTAEAAYTQLSAAEQDLARRLFLRLVHVADDAPPIRAALSLAELRRWDTVADVQRVLDVFVGERMITMDAASARITHDALLDAWPRLRSWIEDGRSGLVTRRRISDAAGAWDEAGRADPWLWRGGQLEVATAYASTPDGRGALTNLASDFLGASTQAERTRQLASRRRTRSLQGLVAVLTALVLAVGVTATYAFDQRQHAITTSYYSSSQQVAIEAGQVRTQDPAVAAQLSIASYGIAHTPQATAALLDSTAAPAGARIIDTSAIAQWTAISPDHTLMAVAGADGTLNLWNVASPGRPMLVDQVVAANSRLPLYVAAFSPDGQVLATAGAGDVVKLWNIADPSRPIPLPTLTGPANTIYSVAFSPDGAMLAAGSADGDAWLWNVADPSAPVIAGRPLAGATAAVNSVAFGLRGKVLAEGSADGRVRLWSLAAPAPVLAARLTGPAQSVSGVAFSPAGELAASSQDHKVWLWKVSLGVPRKSKTADIGSDGVAVVPDGTLTDSKNWTNAVSFSPDGKLLAAGTSEGSVLIWTMATRALAARIPAPQPVTSVTWDGTQRVADSDADGTATIWSLPSPLLLADNATTVVAYSPDGQVIAVGGSNVELWSASTHQLIATQAAATDVNGLAFSPDGRLLAAALGNGTVQVLNAATLAPVGPPFTVTASRMAESVAFSPDGQLLATGSDDGTVRLYSMASPAHPAPLAKIQDSGTPVFTVLFAPDGTTLAAGGSDDYTRLWNVNNPSRPRLDGTPLGGLASYAIGLAFTPNSQLLAIGSADKTVHLWNVADPAHAVPVGSPLTGPSGYVWATAFSPDGTLLAAGSTDGSVWLWNIANPADPSLVATLTGPASHVYSVAFSPSGAQLAASSLDGTVWTWGTSPAAAQARVCANLGHPITPAEWATYAPGVPYKAPCS